MWPTTLELLGLMVLGQTRVLGEQSEQNSLERLRCAQEAAGWNRMGWTGGGGGPASGQAAPPTLYD